MSRSTTLWRTAALLAASGIALAACGTTGGDDDATGGDDGGGGDCVATVAFLGPTTGDYANLGVNIVNGAKLALDEYEGDCEVELTEFDSQGDPTQATPLATEIINDESVIGVLGPTFSGESDATGPAFAEAGLVTVSGSATNPDLTSNGWETFHRIIGTDAAQAPADAALLTGELGATQVFVIDDASEYGAGLAAGVAEGLGDAMVGTETVQQGDRDFNTVVTRVVDSGADAVFFGGYYQEAGLLVNQLRSGGFDGPFVAGDGVLDPGFLESAGGASADNSFLTCPCGPPTPEFAEAYEALSGQAPGTYSPEGYDVMNMFLAGLDAGNTDRAAMLEFISGYDAEGITKHITFDDKGDIAEVTVYSYPVEGGELDLSLGTPIEQ
jgi:branched-chain amino acid transport system substrate-binding protein